MYLLIPLRSFSTNLDYFILTFPGDGYIATSLYQVYHPTHATFLLSLSCILTHHIYSHGNAKFGLLAYRKFRNYKDVNA